MSHIGDIVGFLGDGVPGRDVRADVGQHELNRILALIVQRLVQVLLNVRRGPARPRCKVHVHVVADP